MEDGGQGDPAKPKDVVKVTSKAGWLKKSSGKFFGTYKDRYIQLEHTEIVVYENEDLKNCLERLDLENYEKCHDLRGAFKKKNRLILIKAPKSANKVSDVKLQAQNLEDKEAWIKALSDGINRAKNKIFDEVKVDDGCSLEHVTRTRPKGNRGRRPPTRIHMKGVASVSSDGILRLDLDVTDSQPNGNHHFAAKDEGPKEIISTGEKDDVDTAEDLKPQKKVLKPPMPPSKQQQAKPVAREDEEVPGETSDSGVDSGPPPTPSKPSNSLDDLSSTSSPTDTDPKPPKPPSKDKKPTLEETPKEDETGSVEKGEAENKNLDATDDSQSREEDSSLPTTVLKPSVVLWDAPLPESNSGEKQRAALVETQPSLEPTKKSPGPPAPSKKKPITCPAQSEEDKTLVDTKDEKGGATETSSSEVLSDSDEALSESQPGANLESKSSQPSEEEKRDALPSMTSEPSTELCGPMVVKMDREEEKSVDSGQHSAEESENGDPAPSPNEELRESKLNADSLKVDQAKLDGDSLAVNQKIPSNELVKKNADDPSSNAETCKALKDLDPASVSCRPSKPQIRSPRPLVPLKPQAKARSASMSDLLEDSPLEKKHIESKVKSNAGNTLGEDDVQDLERKVTVELKNTEELLNTISDKPTTKEESQDESTSVLLLATAVEKLRKAEEILSAAQSVKVKTSLCKEKKRNSW